MGLRRRNFPVRVTALPIVALIVFAGVTIWSLRSGQLITQPGGDSQIQHLPSRVLAAQLYHTGHLPLWNSYESSGMPLAALAQPASFYPFTLVFYGLLPPVLAFNLSLTTHFLLLAFFTRRYLQSLALPDEGVTLGAVTFTFCGFMLIHSSAVPIFNAAIWIPAVFYWVEKWIQTERWRYPAYGGICLAMSLLAGWAQLLALTSVYTALYGVLAWSAVRRRARFGAGFVVLFGIAALVVMPQVVLTLDFKPYTSLRYLDWKLFAYTSYPPQLLLLLLFPDFFGVATPGFYKLAWWGPPDASIMTIYVGILPLLLAMAALPQWRVSRAVRFFILLLAATPFMAFGVYTPVLPRILYHLPVFKFFHDHWVNFVFFSFAIAVLAAHAASNLHFPQLSDRGRRIWRLAIPLTVIAAAALTLIFSRSLVQGINHRVSPIADNWLACLHQTVKFRNPAVIVPVALILGFSFFFWIWASYPRSVPLARLAAALIAADLGFFAWSFTVWSAPGAPAPASQQMLTMMQSDAAGTPFRTLTLQQEDPFLKVNANSLQHYDNVLGYEPFLLQPYADLLGLNTGGTTDLWPELMVNHRILSMLNVRYVLAAEPFTGQIQQLTVTDDRQAMASTESGGNLLLPGNWKPVGAVQDLGEVNRFRSDGREVRGISQENISLEKNKIYALTFQARAEEGKRDDLVGLVASGRHVTYCPMREFALSTEYRRNTCLYVTHGSEQKVNVQFLTLSRAVISVKDINLRAVGSLPAAANDYEVESRIGNLTLFANRDVLPRAYFVRWLRPIASYSDARSELWQMSAPLELRDTALVEGLSQAMSRQLDEGRVQELRYGANRVDLRVSCGGNCFLVLADQYVPGWQAFVDGRPATIYRTNAVVRGLFVPPGAHNIRFAYVPHGLAGGFLAAVLGVALAGVLLRLDVNSRPDRT